MHHPPPPAPSYSKWSYLEYFKAIDVQDTNVIFFMVLLHCFVDGLRENNQHMAVNSFSFLLERGVHGGKGCKTVHSKQDCLLGTG